MEAIVLAGGLGTRLRSVVGDLPKPMASVNGRPFLAYVLDQLVAAGFEASVLAVGYRHEAISGHFGNAYRGMALRYSVESEPLGTGGAIRLAWQEGGSPEVFVLNGDTYLETDYGAMLAAHREAGSQLSIAVHHVADTARYGALEIADDRIVGFREKGATGPGWINAGTYLLDSALRTRLPSHGHFSFEQDVLVPEVRSIRPLACRTPGLFIDIGVPDDYARSPSLLRVVVG